MKKILFCVVIAMMATTNMNAQNSYDEHKQEIAISLGGLSNSDIITGFEKIGEALVGVSTDNEKFFGPISAEYFYHLKPWIGVGGIIAYGQMSEDMYFSKKKETKDGKITNHYTTLMPAVKFDWLRRQYFGLYSKLAIGATLRSEKIDYYADDKKDFSENGLHVNWQVSVIGVEAGGTQLRGLLELGTGEQGIALLGVRYKF